MQKREGYEDIPDKDKVLATYQFCAMHRATLLEGRDPGARGKPQTP